MSVVVVSWGPLAALSATLELSLEELRMRDLVLSLNSGQVPSPDKLKLELVLDLAMMV